ncbi:MAG: 30S ribosomal protein S9 [Patescibacteria group bacterium]
MVTTKTVPAQKTEERKSRERYVEATGGRKTAIARARLFSSGSGFTVNGKTYQEYFRGEKHRTIALSPIEVTKEAVRVSVMVRGGGINAQAEAVRNAVAKALVKLNAEWKKRLKREGFITRDSRMVERKKYGLKKARRAPQWQKR